MLKKKIYTDGLKIFRLQELLPVSLETRVQYGDGEITRVWLNETRFGPKKSCPRYISTLKKVVPDISRHYFDALNEHEIAGFDINFLTNLSIRASAILILLARNCKLLARILKCHICM